VPVLRCVRSRSERSGEWRDGERPFYTGIEAHLAMVSHLPPLAGRGTALGAVPETEGACPILLYPGELLGSKSLLS
jgi:hypothetical protein